MKIILIGFMGSGKSVLAKSVAGKLDLPCLDTDDEILKLSDAASISEIFDLHGETHFRHLELSVAQSLQDLQSGVIATGGGLVMNQLAIDALRENGQVIYLQTSLETVLSRIDDKTDRPLMRDKLQFAKLHETRAAIYTHYADYTIQTDNASPEALVETITAFLSPNKASLT